MATYKPLVFCSTAYGHGFMGESNDQVRRLDLNGSVCYNFSDPGQLHDHQSKHHRWFERYKEYFLSIHSNHSLPLHSLSIIIAKIYL